MIFLYILMTSVIILCFSGVTTAEEDITGFLSDTVTLPCAYSSKRQDVEVCWRKAGCSNNTCTSSAILRTNGSSVTKRNSNRYKILGNITKGDASLTITRLTMKDGGTYCCKVKSPGAYNDVKQEVNLQIMEMPVVIGSMNDTVTLPCTYSPSTGVTLCWVRGSCSNSMCLNAIFRSSSKVTNRTSTRYELLGNMTQGNASLTITSLTAEDDGIYCCKVLIPGKNNDVKKEMSLQFLKMPVVIGSMNDTVTLPCTYSPSTGVTLCWIRGSCSNSRCLNAIFRSSSKVTNRTSTRYELLGNMTQGNASLTITSLTAEDDGIYCCKALIPGPSNDVKKEISLQFLKSDGRLNWVLLGNVIRGIIVLLVPTMVILIYKCCPLQSYGPESP